MGSVLSSVGSVLSYFCSPSPLPLASPSPSLLPLPSPSSPPEIKYDVFLSFRGEDTRNNFTSHLNKAFRGKGIDTFIDEDRLNRGDEISPSLLRAIEQSQISVVIFSPNYANSRWCLEELVKILECSKNHGQIVIPVFYEIDPSHVRHQTGSYEVAFTGHQRCFKEDLDKVQKWRCALTEAANLSGFHLLAIKPESVFVEEIVEDVLKRLNNMSSSDNKQLVGIESKITKIVEMLRMGDQTNNDVRKVGICGIGGIGKTTLAQAVFDKFYCQFEGFHFIRNIRGVSEKKDPNYLRAELYSAILGDKNADTYIYSKKRLHRKKLLIVFDDVTSSQQIEDLIGDLDQCCGSGSRIIITSRDRQVLLNCVEEVEDIYMVKELSSNDALKLFCQYAFKQDRPKVEYRELSKGVVQKIRGVPLALKVLGCFLFDKGKEVWESSMKRLENVLDNEIHEVLKISYDGLDHDKKHVFLDIACFFKGWDVNLVIEIMDAIGFYTINELSALEEKCLIVISHHKLMMHDLLQAMGKKIVQEASEDPSERTRLFNHEDICDVLTNATGTKKILGIHFDTSNIGDITLHRDAFKEMHNLRFLQIRSNNNNKIYVPQDFKFCLTGLRYLKWEGYPLKSLQYLKNLVIFNLCESNIEQLWSGDQQFHHLKEIKLQGSRNLTRFPNIRAPKLEVLNLRRCTSLIEMPSSFQHLTRLTDLIIPSCPNLTSVPELPVNLRELNLKWCSSLIELPSSFQRLTKLETLDLRYCRSLTSIPDCTGLTSLEGACRFERSDFRRRPRGDRLPNFVGLELGYCSKLLRLPDLPNNLVEICLNGCSSLIEIPSSIQHLTSLKSLSLNNCTSLTSMPDCSSLMSLQALDLYGCSKLERFPELPNNLVKIYLHGCSSLLEIPSSFEHLRGLSVLIFNGCESLTSIPDLTGLQSLTSLVIDSCSKLQRLPELPNSIEHLFLEKLPIEELPPSYKHLCTLLQLHLIDCSRLKSRLSIFCVWKSLETLFLKNCPTASALSISRYEDGVVGSLLPPIDFLRNLTKLTLSGCGITEIPDSVCCLTSLQRLELDRNNFERIPESIINLSKLSYLNISYCERLKVLPKLPWADIDALNCTSLQELSCPLFLNYPVSVVDTPRVLANFINCFKLDQNSLDSFVNTQLEIQAKSPSNVEDFGWHYPTLVICYPGSEIPKQFTFQCISSFIDVKLPPDYNFLCFALCAVVSFPDQCDAHSESDLSVEYKYYVKSKKGGHLGINGYLFTEDDSSDYNMRSSHVFIGFLCCFLRQIHVDEFTFRFYSWGKDCKVKKCGVHLMFGKHLEVSDESEVVNELYSEESKEEDESYGEESEEDEDESYSEESK